MVKPRRRKSEESVQNLLIQDKGHQGHGQKQKESLISKVKKSHKAQGGRDMALKGLIHIMKEMKVMKT
jgi:hypothetical protein